jgi:NitT/TauT family transport system substrate-binding protein
MSNRIVHYLGIAGAVLLAAACTAAAPTAKPPTKVVFGELKIGAKIPTYIAEKEGYFAAEGLQVEVVGLPGGAELVPALLGGSLNFAHANLITLVQANDRGADMVCLQSTDSAPLTPPDTASILVRVDSPINTVADLSGKTIAVNNIQSLAWAFTVAVLEKAGVKRTAVKFVELPFPDMGQALQQKTIDAAFQIQPFETALRVQKVARSVTAAYIPIIPGAQLGCNVSVRAWADAHKDLVTGFVRAYEKGKAFAVANEAKTRTYIAEWTGSKPEDVKDVVMSLWEPGVNVPRMQQVADLAQTLGLVPNKVDVNTFMYSTALNPPK